MQPEMKRASRSIVTAMDPEVEDAEAITEISSLFWNYDTQSISPTLALQVDATKATSATSEASSSQLAGPQLEALREAHAVRSV